MIVFDHSAGEQNMEITITQRTQCLCGFWLGDGYGRISVAKTINYASGMGL